MMFQESKPTTSSLWDTDSGVRVADSREDDTFYPPFPPCNTTMSPIEEKSMESLTSVAIDNGGVDTVKRKFESDVFLTPVSDGVIDVPLLYHYVKCVKSVLLIHCLFSILF